eukprot:12188-Heterococcus_DN1.PRE.2
MSSLPLQLQCIGAAVQGCLIFFECLSFRASSVSQAASFYEPLASLTQDIAITASCCGVSSW